MYFVSPTSTISSISSMSSSTASSLAMDIRPRSSGSVSSSGFSSGPYRSCLINRASSDEPNSYLSDEDLFGSEDDAAPSPDVELSTEEQIELLRKAAEEQPPKWFQQQQQYTYRQAARAQRPEEQKRKSRPSMGKRKKSSSKKVVFASPAQV